MSTVEQDTDLQLVALREAGCERIFQEKASGAQRDRPELKAALDFMRSGDALVVWKLDRLARSLKQLIDTVEDLEGRAVGFRSLTESIDTTSPSGKLVFQVFGALAEYERGLIRERTLAGLASARARGRVGGRPKGLDGAGIATAKAMLVANPELAVADIARRLGVSTSTLYRNVPAARRGRAQTGDPDAVFT